MSPKGKPNGAVGLPIYDFLLLSNSNDESISHRLAVMGILIFFISLIITPRFRTPHTHSCPGANFLKIESLHPWVRGKPSAKIKMIG